jgi:hypothetical protein
MVQGLDGDKRKCKARKQPSSSSALAGTGKVSDPWGRLVSGDMPWDFTQGAKSISRRVS